MSIWISQIYRSERQNLTQTKPNYCTEWQGSRGTSHSCRLKTNFSKWVCFQSEAQAAKNWGFHLSDPRELTANPWS